jgi:osmoprotectant transport system permease protein
VATGGDAMTRVLADNGLPGLNRVPVWFNDPSNWWGPDGVLARVREHLLYTAIIVVIAAVIALPLGLLVGHTGRGSAVVAGIANGLRAVPTFGFLIFLVVLLSNHLPHNETDLWIIPRGGLPYFIPVAIVLVVLAIPPILSNTYAGVQAVDPAARDAARGMGMRPAQVVGKVELPIALPLIMSGLRSAVLQVIATATVAAFAPLLGGLGRFIVDGEQNLSDLQFGYPAMVCGGIVVAVLALLVDGLLALVQRYAVSPGLTGRRTRRVRVRPDQPALAVSQAQITQS